MICLFFSSDSNTLSFLLMMVTLLVSEPNELSFILFITKKSEFFSFIFSKVFGSFLIYLVWPPQGPMEKCSVFDIILKGFSFYSNINNMGPPQGLHRRMQSFYIYSNIFSVGPLGAQWRNIAFFVFLLLGLVLS